MTSSYASSKAAQSRRNGMRSVPTRPSGRTVPPLPIDASAPSVADVLPDDVDGPLARVMRMPRAAAAVEVEFATRRLDDRQSVSIPALLKSLGWDADTRLAVRLEEPCVTLRRSPIDDDCRWAPATIDSRGRLRLSDGTLVHLGLAEGSEVLIEADPSTGELSVYPQDVLVTALHSLRQAYRIANQANPTTSTVPAQEAH
jgi:hypothetical protein